MRIEKIDSGLLHSCMYLLEENNHSIVIDPCLNTALAEKTTVDYLLVTHEHYDHISGVNVWKQKTGAPLLCSRACAEKISDPKKNLSRYFDVFCEMQTWVPMEGMVVKAVEYACDAELTFEDERVFLWQGHIVRMLETPGHSAGSIIIIVDGQECFTGDSFLEHFDTELRFPGGSRKEWKKMGKPRIDSIPDGTRIWPGHFDSFVKYMN